MTEQQLAELVAEDLAAWLESGKPTRDNPQVAAYQQALGLVLLLREALDEAPGPPSMLAEAMLREDEALGAGQVLGRARLAMWMALEDHAKDGKLSPGTVAALKLARE